MTDPTRTDRIIAQARPLTRLEPEQQREAVDSGPTFWYSGDKREGKFTLFTHLGIFFDLLNGM